MMTEFSKLMQNDAVQPQVAPERISMPPPSVSLDSPLRQQIIPIGRRLPKLELSVFDGQPKKVPMWWNTLQNSVHNVQLD